MELVFATNNLNKLKEVQSILGEEYKIISLKELGCTEDIPETGTTLEENALIKSKYIFEKYGVNCFADDTGLEVDALEGAPGVYSARYAGDSCVADDNMNKLLHSLKGKGNRSACFRTIISLIIDGTMYQFEGRVDGEILTDKTGKDGFGYDPIFQPKGYTQSFAEMSLQEKNKISHRAHAIYKLVEFLKEFGV